MSQVTFQGEAEVNQRGNELTEEKAKETWNKISFLRKKVMKFRGKGGNILEWKSEVLVTK